MSQTANRRTVPVFDRWSRTYEDGRISGFFHEMQALVVQRTGLGPGNRLLDVGCGTGWAVEYAVERQGVGFATGVDLSGGMIHRARDLRGRQSNISFVQADAESLPFDDDSFDAAICSFSFHHYSSPVAALRQVRRVLKPGGAFHVLDNNRASFWGLYAMWDLYFRWTEPGHVRYLTSPELESLFRQTGFREVETTYSRDRLFHGKKVFGSAMIVCGLK